MVPHPGLLILLPLTMPFLVNNTSASREELVNNDSPEERVPVDFMDALLPDGNLPTSQNLFELDNAMSRMKIYSDLANTAVNQAVAAADRADGAADRAVAA